ncbi:MAG: hypothetical protein DRQ78_13050 [Epsilonproteobacteria bacterium]|nr:MAG: hypothetical protein DRQ78_13050 [Campylobacterota bacterium]
MVKVHVEKECDCFKKSNYVNGQKYTSKNDALLHANLMKNYMNQNFCKKHIFGLEENENEIIVTVKEREKERIVACGGDIAFKLPPKAD